MKTETMECDGQVVQIRNWRTQLNTPMGTIWRFITDQDTTIMVVPQSCNGSPAGEAPCIPKRINSLVYFSRLGQTISLIAKSCDEKKMNSKMLLYGPEQRTLIGHEEHIKSLANECQLPNMNINDFAYRQILHILDSNQFDAWNEVLNGLPKEIKMMMNQYISYLLKMENVTETYARNTIISQIPFVAQFGAENKIVAWHVGSDFYFVKSIKVVKQDRGDVDITNKPEVEHHSQAAPTNKTVIAKNSTSRIAWEKSKEARKHTDHNGRKTYKILDIEKHFKLVRHEVEALITKGVLKVINDRNRGANNKGSMRLFWADKVHKALDK